MLTFFAFLLAIAGGVNWLSIGLLQYDFIAGLFGFQASIFSRIVYILFGVGAVYIVIRTIVNKGKVRVFERKKKKERDEQQTMPIKAQNVEASQEFARPKTEDYVARQTNNIFNESAPSKPHFPAQSTSPEKAELKNIQQTLPEARGYNEHNLHSQLHKNFYRDDFFDQQYANDFDDRFDK